MCNCMNCSLFLQMHAAPITFDKGLCEEKGEGWKEKMTLREVVTPEVPVPQRIPKDEISAVAFPQYLKQNFNETLGLG